MENSDILVDVKNGIQTITFNRPNKKNAFKGTMYSQIANILNEAAGDDNVSITVFTGSGDFYSSGNDLKYSMEESMNTTLNTADHIKSSCEIVRKFVAAIINYPKLIIAVVNGPSIGVATTTLALCDIVYASDKAYFLTPFTKLGLCAEGCSSYTFPKIFGTSKASEILYLNYKLTAKEAYQYGFISEIIPHSNLKKIWTKIESYGTLMQSSIRDSKYLVRQTERDVLHAVNDRECLILQKRMQSEDFMDAVMNQMSSKSKL